MSFEFVCINTCLPQNEYNLLKRRLQSDIYINLMDSISETNSPLGNEGPAE